MGFIEGTPFNKEPLRSISLARRHSTSGRRSKKHRRRSPEALMTPVCRDFAVLEDGALAYCLQEQEIEQHYASNVQKNQLVQEDLRVAKRLQGVEEGERRLGSPEHRKQIEESDSAIARALQEDIRRKAEELRQREERDQEIAKQLQDLEEEESRRQKQSCGSSERLRADGVEPLRWAMAGLELESREQLQQDEELARRLQEEEEEKRTRLRTRRNREQNDDYRAAQVAQDEEIARYMQDQELQAQARSPGQGERAGQAHSLSEPRRSHGREEALQSHECVSLVRAQSVQKADAPPGGGGRGGRADSKLLFCRNIAEELDPTFKARSTQMPADGTAVCPPAAGPGHPVPVDGFFDYMDEVTEPQLVSPTKRQPEKVGRQKSRGEKKDGCKQQ